MLPSPEGTTFYFTTKTTWPLLKLLGNKLQERDKFYANFDPFITYTAQSLLDVKCLLSVRCLLNVYLVSSKKYNEAKSFSKTDRLTQIQFDKSIILKYICTSIFCWSVFNPIQDGPFRAARGWGGGRGIKRSPFLKSVTHILE